MLIAGADKRVHVMRFKHMVSVAVLFMFSCAGTGVMAQAAGAGAAHNKVDREASAKLAERQRVAEYDTPIRPDPIGNALVSGGVSGIVTGAAKGAAAGVAAGAISTVRGAALGAAAQKVSEEDK